MEKPATQFDAFWKRIKDNRAIATVMILGTVVIALASFTDAATRLFDLINQESRPAINGDWAAEFTYPWRNQPDVEQFRFEGEGNLLQGTASFLGDDLVILEGSITGNQITFITKSTEYAPDWNDNTTKLATHRYNGQLEGDQIQFVMETYGGFSSFPPVEIIAARQAPNTN